MSYCVPKLYIEICKPVKFRQYICGQMLKTRTALIGNIFIGNIFIGNIFVAYICSQYAI